MTVRHQQVLESVQIHVEEEAPPRPLRAINTGQFRDLGPGAVPTPEEERVATGLRAVGDPARRLLERRVKRDLRQPTPRVRAQHVRDEEIDVAVPVHVRKVDGHRRVALSA